MLNRLATTATAAEPPSLVTLLTRLHQQARLAGVLDALADATAALGHPGPVAATLRDPATAAWHVAALVDASGRPLPFERHGLPSTPFEYAPPPRLTSGPLALLLTDAWGEETVSAVADALHASHIVIAPIGEPEQPRGALIRFGANESEPPAITSLLTHAALAASRLRHASDQPARDGVMPYGAWEERAQTEVVRATRYQRRLSLLAITFDRSADLSRAGALVARSVRRFDLVGRLATTRPTLALLLPEAGATEANALAERLRGLLPDHPFGGATLPDDGVLLDRLLDVALDRLARVEPMASPPTSEAQWRRRLLWEADAETVRCPVCLVAFSRPRLGAANESVRLRERQRVATVLRADCPRHGAYLPLAA